MSRLPRIRTGVLAAKQRLAEGREALRRRHGQGASAIQVCAHLTDLLDGIIVDLYQSALDPLGESTEGGLARQVALVAHGGYGRRDVAPFSDVDLLLLHKPAVATTVEPLARRLVMDLSDVGVQLGFSVRTPAQALRLARRDPVIFTSQTEARYLAGSERLVSGFMQRFRRDARRHHRSLVDAVDRARFQERAQYGQTVYLLEPNIKRSQGALRDIHLARWIGFTRWGQTDPRHLRLLGAIRVEDERMLRGAYEFLLRLRNELHFHAGRPDDVLYRAEQMRIARAWGYTGGEGLLPVEQFMRHYFEHTSGVRDVVANQMASARQPSVLLRVARPLVSHLVERDYRVGPVHIGATRRGLAKLRGDLVQVLRLMDLANRYDKRIEHRTWNEIRDDMMDRASVEVSDEAARRFLSLLSQTPRLGGLLRRLHQLRVLEKLVAGMDHARCLLQFNTYHKYTVDEHSIVAVEQATQWLHDPGLLGEVYRGVRQRSILHLALLIHDLGKGHAEDHCDVGMALAVETAKRLKLKPHEAEMLQLLVHKHLSMSHLAFRRDTSDEVVIVQFASQVGSPELLRMLFILSCADLAAVGPGVLTRWKIDVLAQLYHRTLRHLSSHDSQEVERRSEQIRRQALAVVPDADASWFARQIKSLPPAYLSDYEPQRVIEDLTRLRQLAPDRAIAWARYRHDRRIVQYTIGAYERLTPGIFHRLTGALTSHGLGILAAEIHSLDDDLVLDRFDVKDHDYAGQPPPERFRRVCHALVDALENPTDVRPAFRQTWQTGASENVSQLQLLPTRVSIDNSTSRRYTIVDVFAHDRIGLLYTITRTLYELGLSVGVARIGTYLDQVVDVFYVTDREGRQIEGEGDLDQIRRRLLQAIESGPATEGVEARWPRNR